jgi:hypothetical protein
VKAKMEWEKNFRESNGTDLQPDLSTKDLPSFPTVKKKLPTPFVFSLLLLQQFLSFCQSLNLASTLEYQN